MTQRTTLAIVLATLLVAATAVPAAVAAQTAGSTLTVDVAQDANGAVTVTVSDNGTAVENATVSVDTVDENASYAGEGAHETDANGTVDLPAPNESVSIVVTAVDGDETASTTAELEVPSLDVDVEQAADGEATVTVTHGITGEPVEDADVDVSTVDDADDYDGTGDYESGQNGTVVLPAPEDAVDVWVNVSSGDLETEMSAELQTPALDVGVEQDENAEVTVTVTYSITGDPVDGADVAVSTVDENETYAGTGDHETDENGTVELPVPDQPVEVEISATAGNLSGSATVELENASTVEDEEPENFGQRVSAFVHSLLNGDSQDRRIGLLIAQWVTANNPGNAPDHAGPPEDVGPDGDDEGEEDAENDDDRERGPPEHAVDEDQRDDDEDEDDDDDDRGGPPEHAGSNGR